MEETASSRFTKRMSETISNMDEIQSIDIKADVASSIVPGPARSRSRPTKTARQLIDDLRPCNATHRQSITMPHTSPRGHYFAIRSAETQEGMMAKQDATEKRARPTRRVPAQSNLPIKGTDLSHGGQATYPFKCCFANATDTGDLDPSSKGNRKSLKPFHDPGRSTQPITFDTERFASRGRDLQNPKHLGPRGSRFGSNRRSKQPASPASSAMMVLILKVQVHGTDHIIHDQSGRTLRPIWTHAQAVGAIQVLSST